MCPLLEGITGNKLEFPVWFGGFYGLRRSEVIGLRWSQIDFDNDLFYVDYTVTKARVNGKVAEKGNTQTKTEQSRRAHPLIEPLKIKLLQRKNEIEKHRILYGNAYNEIFLDFVCVDDLGNRIKLDYVTSMYSILLKKIGLRKIRFHDLRHPYVKPTTGPVKKSL
ncbi:MAG: tyrosine-type recombinase/integrase [Christensenellaceae bacterium]|jgi:integrase